MVRVQNLGSSSENAENIQEKNNTSGPNMESITENGVYYMKNQCIEIMQKSKKFIEDAKLYDKIDKMMKFMLANPIILVGFIIVTAVFVIPILLFTFFAIINVAIAFTSFIIIQVMLILIGITAISCVLFFTVSAVVLVAVAFILTFYITYFTIMVVKKKIYAISNKPVLRD